MAIRQTQNGQAESLEVSKWGPVVTVQQFWNYRFQCAPVLNHSHIVFEGRQGLTLSRLAGEHKDVGNLGNALITLWDSTSARKGSVTSSV